MEEAVMTTPPSAVSSLDAPALVRSLRSLRPTLAAGGLRADRENRDTAENMSLLADAGAAVHEVAGARATSGKFGLDRFWRNARTFASHYPTDAKNVYVGSYEVTGELPPVSSFLRV
jgi:hypothetical protein